MKKFLLNAIEVLINIRYYIVRILVIFLPSKSYPSPTTVFNWKIFKSSFRLRHAFLGLFTVTLAIGGIFVLEYYFPLTNYSLMTGISTLINTGISKLVGHKISNSFITNIGVFTFLALGSKSTSNLLKADVIFSSGLPKWAMREEIMFRSGSENRNPIQILLSSLVFGSIHIINIIYPIAACISLSLSGFIFTVIYIYTYKKTASVSLALRESATVHTTHNIIALVVLMTVLLVEIPYLIFSLI